MTSDGGVRPTPNGRVRALAAASANFQTVTPFAEAPLVVRHTNPCSVKKLASRIILSRSKASWHLGVMNK